MNTESDKISEAEAFFKKWFSRADPNDFLPIFSTPSKITEWFTVSDLKKAAEYSIKQDSSGQNVYYSVCPHTVKAPKGRGTKKTVAISPGIWIDIDTRPPPGSEAAHNAKPETLPPSIKDAEQLIEDAALPEPSAVVFSGHGLHAFWFLNKPLEKSIGEKLVKDVQERIRQEATKHGWVIDETADVSRILRVPGTHNRKIGCPVKSVQILKMNGLVYSAEDFSTMTVPTALVPAPSVAVTPIKDRGADPSKALTLDEIRTKLKKVKTESQELIEKLLKGESIANGGGRDNALNAACGVVAFTARGHTEPETMAEIFRPMLSGWAAEPRATKTVDEEIAKTIEKLERANEDCRQKEAEEIAKSEAFLATRIVDARASTGRTGKYTDQELEQFAADQNTDRASFRQRWIIQHKDAYYIFVEGDYQKPISGQEVLASVTRDLAPSPVELHKVTKTGLVRKTISELVTEYGAVARNMSANMTAERTLYDPKTQTLNERICKPRLIAAREHKDVAKYLELLGGIKHEKLLDWIACVRRLDRQCCALYLSGKPSGGKGLLAQGLARLYVETGPADYSAITANFNDAQTTCPILFGDEDMGEASTSAVIRRVLGNETFELKRKFKDSTRVKGSSRIILCANNDLLLSFLKEDLDRDAIEALALRFLHVDVGSASADYLKSLGGYEYTKAWVAGNALAEHAVWLEQTRTVVEGTRLIVEGDSSEMIDHMTIRNTPTARVCERLADCLHKGEARNTRGVRAGDNKILVNAALFHETWDSDAPLSRGDNRKPSLTTISKALAKLAHNTANGPKRGKIKLLNGELANAYDIRSDFVFDTAERLQIGDRAALEDIVNRNLKEVEEKEAAHQRAKEQEALRKSKLDNKGQDVQLPS